MHIIFNIEYYEYEEIIMKNVYIESAQIFKALGESKRVMIVDMLSCGEQCVCKILEKFNMSQSTLSHHLKILFDCDLIKARNEGKWTYYSLNEEIIEKAKQSLCFLFQDKSKCICNDKKVYSDDCKCN